MPPLFAESTDVVAPGKVRVTVGGGAGAASYFKCGLCNAPIAEAAFLRVRVGIGEHQELGAVAFGALTQSASSNGIGAIGGGALSYKLAASHTVAFVADAGAIDQAFTGDVGLIVAPYTDSGGRQLYTGVRGLVAVPVGIDRAPSSVGVTAPVGFMLPISRTSRFYVEAGAFVGGSHTSYPVQQTVIGTAGGYGSIAIEVRAP